MNKFTDVAVDNLRSTLDIDASNEGVRIVITDWRNETAREFILDFSKSYHREIIRELALLESEWRKENGVES